MVSNAEKKRNCKTMYMMCWLMPYSRADHMTGTYGSLCVRLI